MPDKPSVHRPIHSHFFYDRMASLTYGFFLPLEALRLILRNRRLALWSAVPVILTLALSIWGVAWLKAEIVNWGVHRLAASGYSPGSIPVRAAMIFLDVFLFVMAAISFSFFAGIIASPFNDFLAQATEPFTRPPLPLLGVEKSRLLWKLRVLSIDLLKTVVVASVQTGLLFLGILGFWLPGLNLIPFAAAFWLLAFQFLSYPQTRRGEGFRESVKFLFRKGFATFGFGAAIGLLFALPLISSLALPLAVVGGTLLYARAHSDQRLH